MEGAEYLARRSGQDCDKLEACRPRSEPDWRMAGSLTSEIVAGIGGRLLSFLANFFNSSFEPLSFITESSAAIKLFQGGVACEDIKSDAPLQLPQADWTKVQRTAIAFGEMI